MTSAIHTKEEQGMIRWFLLIIIALVLASYFFNFSVQDAVEDEQTQQNASYISQQSTILWENHLKEPVLYFWNDIFLDLIWSAFTENMERLREGEHTVYEDNAPGVDVNTTTDITNDPIEVGSVNNEEEEE